MSVSDGQKVNAAVTNAAYISKTTDSSTSARIDLANALAASGSSISNIQRLLNHLVSYLGTAVGGAHDAVPTWTNNNYGASTDPVKERTDVLDGELASLATIVSGLQALVGVELPTWTKFTIDYLDIGTAALTNTVTGATIPIQGVLHKIIVKHSIAFSGGSVSALTVDAGIPGESARYVDDFDVFTAPTDTLFEAISGVEVFNFGATTDIELAFTAVGDNLDQLTAGSLDLYLLTSTLP